mmetsp:Transcript_28570/g.91856  ORF Transcript_28570/g.91856 Transcript_28570/m.91856 type:complete len:680 (-) Transcript_28570:174-2213(-)
MAGRHQRAEEDPWFAGGRGGARGGRGGGRGVGHHGSTSNDDSYSKGRGRGTGSGSNTNAKIDDSGLGTRAASWKKQNQQVTAWSAPMANQGDDGQRLQAHSSAGEGHQQGMGRGKTSIEQAWKERGMASSSGDSQAQKPNEVRPESASVGNDLSRSDAPSNSETQLTPPNQFAQADLVYNRNQGVDRLLDGTWMNFGSVPPSYTDKYSGTLMVSQQVPLTLQNQLKAFASRSMNGVNVATCTFGVTAELLSQKSLEAAPVLPVQKFAEWIADRERQRSKGHGCVLGMGDQDLQLCHVKQDAVQDGDLLDHGFVLGVITAWCKHLPLILKPDHIMLLVLQAITRHVNDQPKELPSLLVTHSGKQRLEVACDDCSYDAMVPQFVRLLKEKVGEFATPAAKRSFTMEFSTSTDIDRLVADITLMDATKQFFEFWYAPMCGFPSITLMGTADDWRKLRKNVEDAINALTTFDFALTWLPALLPALDRFISASEGAPIDACFWNAMCKRCGITDVYSSAHSIGFNGWIHVFFPSLNGKSNPLCVPYSPSRDYAMAGLKDFFMEIKVDMLDDFGTGKTVPVEAMPSGLGEVPLVEHRVDGEVPVKLFGGFVGFTQDPVSKAVCPAVSWYLVRASTARRHEAIRCGAAPLVQQGSWWNWWNSRRRWPKSVHAVMVGCVTDHGCSAR